jgi:extracellular elastinolytic metalloproteinase
MHTQFEVEMQDNWYEAAVGAAPPHNIISVVDWASDASVPAPQKGGDAVPTYNVFGWGVNDPSEGNRTLYKDTPDELASPAGWHAIPYDNDPSADASVRAAKKGTWRNTTTTFGNNVFAHENWEGRNSWLDNYRPDAGAGLKFDYAYAPKETNSADAMDEAKKYVNATITQLFVTSNLVHDLYYRYGFTEAAGNFQQHNFGRGGREGDGVIANAQDGSGFNNANFMTPPDGQNGRCRMYLWNTANPYRDGDLEAGIVIHELSHGLSTRLTGGPADSGCLGWGESGGMGEGWGDFLATTIRATRNYSDYAMGEWAANRPGGIRNYVYSLNETVNPSTYQTLDRPGYWGVHAIGEVWAEMLWVVSQRLIAKHGYSDTLFPPAPLANGTVPAGDFYRSATTDAFGKPAPLVPKHGNTLAVQLVMNGMKLQPCRPSFFDARDAIIQADAVLTGGENTCELWRGFAARGLGPDATVVGKTPWGGGKRRDDSAVPAACRKEKIPERDE